MVIRSGSKKKIVLIESQSPGKNVFSGVLLPRIGIVLLGTILQRKGYDVKVFIENFSKIDWKLVKEADLIGISTITCTTTRGYEIAKICKDMGKTVVIGGSHATFMAEEAVHYADYVCIGESEKIFPELVDAILGENTNPKKVKGIAYNQNSELIKTEPGGSVTEQDLDRFPFPDYSLIYGKPKMRTTPIISSRGCPNNCKFCSVIAMFGRKMRYRSEENVIAEIKYQNPKNIFFYDDNFTTNHVRTIKILKKILEFRRPLTWSAQVDVGLADNVELIRLMKKAGCEYVYVGFESISPETLEAYNKKQSRGKIEYFLDIFRRHKIAVHGMLVFDPRNDDEGIIKETSEFIKAEKISTVQLLNLTPFPGTPLWQEEEKNLLTRDWSRFDAHHVVLPAKRMTSYKMQIMMNQAMRRFYSLSNAWSAFYGGNFFVAKLRIGGWQIVRQWVNDDKNIYYLKSLSEKSQFAG